MKTRRELLGLAAVTGAAVCVPEIPHLPYFKFPGRISQSEQRLRNRLSNSEMAWSSLLRQHEEYSKAYGENFNAALWCKLEIACYEEIQYLKEMLAKYEEMRREFPNAEIPG
jgi:hypothetical protein